jgi:2'-5' RNA ligase superfamily
MSFFLGIPAPPWLCAAVERFQHHYARWAQRPQRSEPHISIKGPAGLTHDAQSGVEAITRDGAPFSVTLTEPAVFTQERVLHLRVSSVGWQRLHRQLVDTIIARSSAEPHPLARRLIVWG